MLGVVGRRHLSASHPPRSTSLRLWLTTKVFVVGKRNSVEPWIEEGCSEFVKRLVPVMSLETIYLKSDEALVDAVQREKGFTVCCDEGGKSFTSREFSQFLFKGFELGGAQVNFVVGGFAGLPPELKEANSNRLLSLSKMTWTHQMARLLLVEQIYRASEIHKGSAYHKD